MPRLFSVSMWVSGAHLDVPMGAGDALQLTEPIDGLQPTAQSAIALCRCSVRHAGLHTAET